MPDPNRLFRLEKLQGCYRRIFVCGAVSTLRANGRRRVHRTGTIFDAFFPGSNRPFPSGAVRFLTAAICIIIAIFMKSHWLSLLYCAGLAMTFLILDPEGKAEKNFGKTRVVQITFAVVGAAHILLFLWLYALVGKTCVLSENTKQCFASAGKCRVDCRILEPADATTFNPSLWESGIHHDSY